MTYVTGEIINLFNFLLPGFIPSFLFYSLTSFPKKDEERKEIALTNVAKIMLDAANVSIVELVEQKELRNEP